MYFFFPIIASLELSEGFGVENISLKHISCDDFISTYDLSAGTWIVLFLSSSSNVFSFLNT